MREEQKRQFFAMKSGTPHTAKVNGKFRFSSLPSNIQDVIKKRIAEKDEVMARGLSGELPGLKIDGRQVTRENLHEFELSNQVKKVEVIEDVTKKVKEKSKVLYKKSDLEKLSFKKLKVIGKKFGTTDRSKTKLIKEILTLQIK